jgi:protein tyrosine phosphatase (PTP) superfamily phosphohydrolase (DUF442 family)
MTPDDITQIQNLYQVNPRLLTAGQPYKDQFAAIQAAGCRVVINLAKEYSLDFLPDERVIVENLGMQYVAIPVEWEAPQRADLDAFFASMQLYAGQTIFVHCARNMRVSAFVFLYRVLNLHQPVEDCLTDLHALWQPNPVWQSFIEAQLSPDSP